MFDGRFDIRLRLVRAEQVGNNLFSGERSERERTNKLLGRTRHHHLHANTAVLQQADDFRRLISCDSTGHAQRNFHDKKTGAFSFESKRPPEELMPQTVREFQT